MPRKFSSYLIRWWRRGGTERLEVEHIQSGRKGLAASLEDALAWLDAQERGAEREDERGDAPAQAAPGTEESSEQ